MPKVSVIIPNYNHAPFLEKRLNSVINQNFLDFEVIILDDCSTDNSREIIERYRNHPKINTIIYNQKNSGGTFLQWKKGIELAKGEWVWLAESDDWCEISFLQELVDGLKTDSNCTLSYCQSVIFDGNEILYVSGTEHLRSNMNGAAFVNDHMLRNNAVFNASMCIFKKSAYINITNEFIKYSFIGDWIFWTEIALQGNVSISGRTLNYFRNHSSDVTTNSLKTGIFYIEYFNLLKHFKNKNLITKNKASTLLKDMQKRFLLDYKVETNKDLIHQTFKAHLGFTYYNGLSRYHTWRMKRKISCLWASFKTKIFYKNDEVS